jgi:Zn finger protein HypA/HybF involved in hydrogenase expression
MLKLILGAMLTLLTSAAFLFSKEKDEPACKHSLTGTIKEVEDATGHHLFIETPDHKLYCPSIESERVVLSAGSKVRVCYDTVGNVNNLPKIRINHVSYLP